MGQTLQQLGQLLFGSIPTIILLAILYVLYTFLVYRPLRAVLAERRNRTEGAVEKARADIATAEARTSEYEQRLREARQKVFKSLEMRRQKASQVRSEAVNQARLKAQEQVKHAREAIEQDKQTAITKLEGEAGRLASEIVRTVLRPLEAPSQVGG
jgi:F-type H+-transporting ATPase subunit b